MLELEQQAKDAGIIVLNEIGVRDQYFSCFLDLQRRQSSSSILVSTTYTQSL